MSGTNYIASNWRTPTNQNSSKNDNYSLDFNGSSDFISCGNDPQIQLTGDISISAWFKTTSTGTMIVAAKRDSPLGGNTYGWQLYCSGGVVRFLVTRSGPTTTSINGTTNIADGAWHHVLCTINQDSQIAIILDGGTEGTASLPAGTFIDSNSDLRIGYNQIGSAHYYFNGEISEVALFDYLASGAALYGNATSGSGNPMALKPTPVGYWPLGDNSASDPLAQPNVAVEDASVFYFDGSTDYITVPKNITTDFSVSFWIKPDTSVGANFDGILGQGTTSAQGGILRYVAYDGTGTSGSVFVFIGSFTNVSGTVTNGVWTNIVLTYDSTADELKGYNNGSLYTTISNPNFSGQTTDAHSFERIGMRNGTTGTIFNGLISNVAIFDSLQSATVIYNNGVPGDLSSLNPTAWWKLDQSANWEADTVGTWQIPDAVSEFPQSFDFTGVNGVYVDAGNSGGINFTSAFSVGFWFKTSSTATMYTSHGATGDIKYFLQFGGSVNRLRLQIYDGTGTVLQVDNTQSTFYDNNWHHLAFTTDGTTEANKVIIYFDGQPLPTTGTLSNNGIKSTSGSLKIGAYYNTQNTFDGQLSNFQTWDTELSSTKIETLYNSGTPTLTPPNQSDLKAWYKLDNTELFDGSNWNLQNQVYPANYKSALDFDESVQSRINLSPDVDLGINSTISAWYKWDGTPALNDILIGLDFSYVLYFSDPNTIIARIGSVFKTFSFTTLANVWYNLVMVRTGDSIELFINNSSIGTQTGYGTAINTTFDCIGARASGAFPFNGLISNVAGFNSSLNSSEIETIYNSGTPETSISSSPVSWWKLNNLTTGIQDSAGSNDGTNNGATKVNTFVSTEAGTSTGLVEQSLVNNNVSALNGESSGMTSGNLVLSDLTRNLPYENYSLDFDGSLDYIDCGDSDIFSFGNGTTDSPFSISAWVKMTDVTDSSILSKTNVSPTDYEYSAHFNSEQIYFGVYSQNSTSNYLFVNYSTNLTSFQGSWIHLTFTYDGSSNINGLKIYLNATRVDDVQLTSGTYVAMNNTVAPLKISRSFNNRYLNGKISNTSIFNVELTPTEVLKLYANGLPQDLTNFTPQPISWWTLGKESFWDGADWIIRDMIGTNDGLSDNMGGSELKGDAPRSQANGVGTNIAVPTDLKGEAGWSDKNGYSINMSSTARTTDTP